MYIFCVITCFASDSKAPIETTNIPSHLEQMLILLKEEDDAEDAGGTGACLEYLLQHKLLDTLQTLARADVSEISRFYETFRKQLRLRMYIKILKL